MAYTRLHSWAPTKSNKRKDKRTPTDLPAIVGNIAGKVVDISLGGMGFQPDSYGLLPGIETNCILKFSSGDISINCKIVDANRDMTVFGVQFLGLDPIAFKKIEYLLTHPGRGR